MQILASLGHQQYSNINTRTTSDKEFWPFRLTRRSLAKEVWSKTRASQRGKRYRGVAGMALLIQCHLTSPSLILDLPLWYKYRIWEYGTCHCLLPRSLSLLPLHWGPSDINTTKQNFIQYTTTTTKGENTWLLELVFALLTSRSLTYAFDRPASIPDGPIFWPFNSLPAFFRPPTKEQIKEMGAQW